MRQSQLFTKTRKEAPKDEQAKNAQLLIRAGFVHKEMAGVYSYLPLGRRTLRKIEQIVREEMDAIGGQEIDMATLHPSDPWKTTGAWDSVDVLFKIQSRTEKEYALGQSEEEIVTPIAQEYISSYKDLPKAIYQIGNKYRDELRAKSGVMRGREFRMKDMYSFHATQEDFDAFYTKTKEAYLRVYSRMGLTAKVTEASGGAFTQKISYEFMVLTDAGEDTILYCTQCTYCVNSEITEQKAGDTCTRCDRGGTLTAGVASEVGNIFDLGRKYTEAFTMNVKDEKGNPFHPIMGCFGIGTTRLLGVIAETFSDTKGLAWPLSVSPMPIHIVSLANGNPEIEKEATRVYDILREAGIEVLYDDRDARAGEKFADSDLIGLPLRVIVSEKNIAQGGVEVVYRKTGESEFVPESRIPDYFTELFKNPESKQL